MSDPKPEERVNPFAWLKHRQHDEKASLIRDLITSDRNNETKTRISHVFGMSVFDLLGAWSSPTEEILYDFQNEKKTLPKTVEGMAQFFGHRYRINAISKNGLSREEYEHAASSYLAQQAALGQSMQQARVEEGAKKKT